VGIDIGGTFTDVVALDTTTGRIISTKVPSTPKNFAEGFFNGFNKVLNLTGSSSHHIGRLIHGTTVATNAIMERKGARIGILANEGFEDVLIMGRQWRSDMYSLVFDPETPTFLCDRQRLRGIRGRMDYAGNVTTPLNDEDIIEAVDDLVQKHGVQSIAVCYLFSFVNPSHERRTERIIRERYPEIRVSLSSRINPRFREYERACITAFDAYVGPRMEDYIRVLQEEMCRRNVDVVLQVMQSRGGITSGTMCIERPVVTLLSGPAGGVAGGIFVGKTCGRENLITLDMGGTTNDVALVRQGKPYLSLDGKIDKYPLRQAMIDITTIGAGGGSIAWVDAAGGLKVGPSSAGADPGPACYDRGGQEPTMTDSSVALGYLNPDYFAAGELLLKPELSRRAIRDRVAEPLGMSVVEAAAGIQRIVSNNMADQIRLVSVYRGYHPKDFSLIAFGGAGPVVAGRLMQILGMKEVIVPANPGVLSAFGLLVADIEHEEVASFKVKAAEVDPKEIMRIFSELGEVCEQKREKIGISETNLHIFRSTEMRYVGQSYELQVPFPEGRGEITREIIQDVVRRFHDTHQSIYQHSAPESPVEFIAFRTVFSEKPRPMPRIPELKTGTEAEPKGRRDVYFEEYEGFVETPLYERIELVPGQKLGGPAIVEQTDTTTVIYPDLVTEVDKWGNLILQSL
jgi:N-methylhydantoinase A